MRPANPTNPENPSALSWHAVTVRAGQRVLLDAASLALPARGLLGIVGANGAGKSTLLRAAIGVTPLASGAIELAGRPVASWSRRDRAARLG